MVGKMFWKPSAAPMAMDALICTARFVDIRFGSVKRQPMVGDGLYFRGEEAPSIGKIGEYENDEKANQAGDRAFNDI
jgi:hypothetical protein